MDRFERLQALIAEFEAASIRKSGGKTRAVIRFAPAYVNCNANLKPEGQSYYHYYAPPAWAQQWTIAYYYANGEPHSSGGSVGNTIEEAIAFLELHFERFPG